MFTDCLRCFLWGHEHAGRWINPLNPYDIRWWCIRCGRWTRGH